MYALQTNFTDILNNTIQQPWFIVVDLIGIIAFSISGLVVAYRERVHLFGAFILAVLPAVGGGIIRDLIVDRRPIAILESPVYLLTIIGTLFSGYLLLQLAGSKYKSVFSYKKLNKYYDISDAIGLSAFTIIGVVVAVRTHCQPLWLWGPLLAVITSIGGGVMRDLCKSTPQVTALKDLFYAEISILWGLIFSLFLIWQQKRISPEEINLAVILIFIGTFITRMLSLHYKWRSSVFTNNSLRGE